MFIISVGQSSIKRFLHASRPLKKLIPFILADIGEGITEVEILQWHIKEGNAIRQFEKIAEVQSDKATVEITSRYEGIVKRIHYEKGATARVGTPLVDIEVKEEEEGEGREDENTAQEQKETTSSSGDLQVPVKFHEKLNSTLSPTIEELKNPVKSHDQSVKAMPGVRHFARVNGVDISLVKPSGNSGQVTKDDLLEYLKDPLITPTLVSDEVLDEYQLVPLNAFQKAMFKSMNAGLNIPHFGFHDEVGLDALSNLRNGLVGAAEERFGVRLTTMAFFIKALSLALTEYPILNSHFDGKLQVLKHYNAHNVGVAVDTEHGLAVPVIKKVQHLSIISIARELGRLSDAARANKLSSEELSGGTITLSNIGSIGGTTASPIILSPQVCILALGRVQMLPRFSPEMQLVPRKIMPVSWSADHRVIDGATVARFSQRWRSLLDDPSRLLFHLTQP